MVRVLAETSGQTAGVEDIDAAQAKQRGGGEEVAIIRISFRASLLVSAGEVQGVP